MGTLCEDEAHGLLDCSVIPSSIMCLTFFFAIFSLSEDSLRDLLEIGEHVVDNFRRLPVVTLCYLKCVAVVITQVGDADFCFE